MTTAATDDSNSKEDQIKQIQALGAKFAELRDVRGDDEFLRKGAILARDIFNIGFVNGKNAGYNEGFNAAIQEVKGRIGSRRIQEELK